MSQKYQFSWKIQTGHDGVGVLIIDYCGGKKLPANIPVIENTWGQGAVSLLMLRRPRQCAPFLRLQCDRCHISLQVFAGSWTEAA